MIGIKKISLDLTNSNLFFLREFLFLITFTLQQKLSVHDAVQQGLINVLQKNVVTKTFSTRRNSTGVVKRSEYE